MSITRFAAAGTAAALVIGLFGAAPAIAAPVAAAPSPGFGEVSGKLTIGSSSTPVTDATITLSAPGIDWTPGVAYGWTTGSDGSYVVNDVPPGKYILEVYAYDQPTLATYSGNTVRRPDAKVITVSADATVTENVKVAQAASVKGRVLLANNKPAKGISVWAFNTTRAGYASGTTDPNGYYEITGLATGKIEISASVYNTTTGITSQQIAAKLTVTQGKTTSKNLKLKKVAASVGKISVKVTGKKGANVSIVSAKKGAQYVGYSTTVDKKGKATFSDVPVGKYRVVISGTNIASKVVTVKKGKTAKAGTLKHPKKTTTIKGTLKLANGKVAKNTSVWVNDSYGTFLGSVSTNAKGKYSIKGAVSGKYTVWASAPQGSASTNVTKSLTVKKGAKSVTKNIKLAKGYTIKGTIKNGGKPVAGLSVYGSSGNKSAVTDKNGKFTLTGLAKGKASIWVNDPYTGGFLDLTSKFTVKKNATKNLTVKK